MQLSEISGLGKTRLAQLFEASIFSCEEFLNYFPRKYYNFANPSPYAYDGTYKMVRAMLVGEPKVMRIKKTFVITTAKFQDSFGNDFSALWYNQPYIKNALSETKEYFLYGKDDKRKKNTMVVTYFKSVEKSNGLGLFPIYKSIGSISSEVIRHSMDQMLSNFDLYTCLNEQIEGVFELETLKNSYKNIHQPQNILDLSSAKDRIMIEKLVPIIYLKDGLGKLGRSDRKHNYENLDSVLAELKSCLPFELTQSQVKAIGEIINDLYSDKNMNRLLEGDVGSGKTVVAMFSLLSAIKNGYQSVLLAPTEILALEHYKLLCKTFENINGVNIAYLSSSLDSKTKRETLTNIENGTANIIVGSHSVFSKSVKYKNLSLVVIDEQHKFGVRARGTLQEKGDNVDTLVMSATPIPRSLKLVFDGVLDISILAARPHKNNVHTNILSMSKVDDMWKYIDTKIQNGSKVFVVCPKIEESDDDTMVSAKEVYEILKDKLHANIELVHGKQDRSETDKLFTGFKSGETNVLVSTSIIEVGVDTKDADIMVIMNASNFGLASLHQLRGRVGRDGRESYCFCVLPENTNVKALDRLKFFKNNTDGFKIAEYDLESRGAGNANGTEQHGLESSDIWGYRVELYELATRIVSYMKNIGVKPNINDQKYAKIIENLVDAVAMN